MTLPRTNLATSTQIDKPIAMYTCQKPLPSDRDNAITSNNVGIDQKTLIIQTIILSKYPP